MKAYSPDRAASILAKISKRWVMYVSFYTTDGASIWAYNYGKIRSTTTDEVKKCAPWIDTDKKAHNAIFCDEYGFLTYTTEEEMRRDFNRTKGDERCKNNNYDGPVRCYCAMFAPDGTDIGTNT